MKDAIEHGSFYKALEPYKHLVFRQPSIDGWDRRPGGPLDRPEAGPTFFLTRQSEIDGTLDAALVEEVSQGRRYRNWVAHGRRGEPPDAVDPRTASNRLQRFLDRLDEAAGPVAG